MTGFVASESIRRPACRHVIENRGQLVALLARALILRCCGHTDRRWYVWCAVRSSLIFFSRFRSLAGLDMRECFLQSPLFFLVFLSAEEVSSEAHFISEAMGVRSEHFPQGRLRICMRTLQMVAIWVLLSEREEV